MQQEDESTAGKVMFAVQTQNQLQIYHYTVNIISVNMKIKFPCRMHLELQNKTITNAVSAHTQNKFNFNEEIILVERQGQNFIDLSIQLTTDKGINYMGGIIKIIHRQLIHSEGEIIVLPLIKCLDLQAYCQMRVEQVTAEKIQKSKTKSKPSLKIDCMHLPYQPKNNKKSITGSKSELNLCLNTHDPKSNWKHKNKHQQYSYINAVKAVNPHKIQRPYINNHVKAENYRQSFEKLKQKYKRQAEVAKAQLTKRLSLQVNENNQKFEIMRLKLKNQDQQKKIVSLSHKVHTLQTQLNQLHKKQLDCNFIKEQNNNQCHQIELLQSTIKSLTKQNEHLIEIQVNQSIKSQEQIKLLKMECSEWESKMSNKQFQSKRQIIKLMQQSKEKQAEMQSKVKQIQRNRQTIEELEDNIREKIFEYGKSLMSEKAKTNCKIQSLKTQMETEFREKEQIKSTLQENSHTIQELRVRIQKINKENEIMHHNYETLKSHCLDLQVLKSKLAEQTRKNKKMQEENQEINKQIKKVTQNSQRKMRQIQQNSAKQIDNLKIKSKQLQQKQKNTRIKIKQYQVQFQLSRNSTQKMKKHQEQLQRDIKQLKNKEKQYKSMIKSKDQNILVLQNQLAHKGDRLMPTTSSSQLNNLKQQNQHLNTELIKLKVVSNKNNELQLEVNKLKLQLQHSQDRYHREEQHWKKIQGTLKMTIVQLDKELTITHDTVRQLQHLDKQQSLKIQKWENQLQKNRERTLSLKNQLKNMENQLQAECNSNRNTSNLSSTLKHEKQTLYKKITELTQTINTYKVQSQKQTVKHGKNIKLIENLQKQSSKLKAELTKQIQIVAEQNQRQETVKQQLKKVKEELQNSEVKIRQLGTENQKVKQKIIEIVMDNYHMLPEVSNNSIKKDNMHINKSINAGLDVTGYITIIMKQVKQKMTKMAQGIKTLEKNIEEITQENDELRQILQQTQRKEENNSRHYEQQTNNTLRQKQFMKENMQDQIFQLKSNLKQQQNLTININAKIQQYQYINNNFKVELQMSKDEGRKCEYNLKKIISELRQTIDYQNDEINNLQAKIHQLSQDLFNTQNELNIQQETNYKIEQQFTREIKLKEKLQLSLQELSKQKQKLKEKMLQLELFLSTEKQLKQNNIALLQEEETKNKQLKNFIQNLMRQKQMAIKSELELNDNINKLQNNCIDASRERQILQEQNEKHKKQIQQLRDNVKKFTQNLKNVERSAQEDKTKMQVLEDKVKNKEKQIKEKETTIRNVEEKLKKVVHQSHLEVQNIKNQRDQNSKVKVVNQKEINDKVKSLQKDNNRLQNTLEQLKNQKNQSEQNLFTEKQIVYKLRDKNENLQKITTEMRQSIDKLEQVNRNLNQQIREKQQQLLKLNDKAYNLQIKIQSIENQRNQKIQVINTKWDCKLQLAYEEYEQKIQILQQQKEHLKQLMQQRQKEYKLSVQEIKMSQEDTHNLNRIYQQKIRTLQEDKLILLSQKNVQIQRIAEQCKRNYESLKEKESDYRKTRHELQISNNTVNKLDMKLKQTEQKIKNINKTYANQLQHLKKKQMAYREFRQTVNNGRWKCEREVHKIVQRSIQQIMNICDERNSLQMLQISKSIQQDVIKAISAIEVKLQLQ